MAKTLVTRGGFVSAADKQARKIMQVNSKTFPADARTGGQGSHPNAGVQVQGGASTNGGTA